MPGQFGIVGDSPEIRAVFEEIHLFGPANGPVWIWGESGVGKGMIAQALHARSPRHDKPFAHYACGNIRQHIEDTLFGHGKATFTGVPEDRVGAFLLADHGMFFLDECDGLDEAIQERLLIVSEQGWFRPLGADERVDVDVRMIMASKVAPWELVRQKKLREDVAERLARFQIRGPSLRERRSDLRHLVPYLLGKDENGKHLVCSPKAMKLLHKLELPGNVRGLENLLCNAALRARGSGVILPEHVQAALVHRGPSGPATGESGPAFRVGERLMTEAEHKAEYRRYVIQETGSKVAAADALDISRSTLDESLNADGSPAKKKPKGRGDK